jgi:hypothetical protein
MVHGAKDGRLRFYSMVAAHLYYLPRGIIGEVFFSWRSFANVFCFRYFDALLQLCFNPAKVIFSGEKSG